MVKLFWKGKLLLTLVAEHRTHRWLQFGLGNDFFTGIVCGTIGITTTGLWSKGHHSGHFNLSYRSYGDHIFQSDNQRK